MFKSIFKSSFAQPVLTIILICLLGILIFRFTSGTNEPEKEVFKEIAKEISFEEAAAKFNSDSFQIYTRGSLFLKNAEVSEEALLPTNPEITPTKTIKITETKYTDLFFFIQNGQLKRIDTNNINKNDARFFNEKGELVLIDNLSKSYINYPIPSPENKENLEFYESSKKVFSEFFPLIPLLRDYQDNKFTPTERAYNLYSGKWQHEFFTSGETVDVFLETDPTSGTFRNFVIAHEFGDNQTKIFFDFRQKAFGNEIYSIPEGYQKVEVSE